MFHSLSPSSPLLNQGGANHFVSFLLPLSPFFPPLQCHNIILLYFSKLPRTSLCFSGIYLLRWAHGCQGGAMKTWSLTTPLTTELVPGKLSGTSTLLQVTHIHAQTRARTAAPPLNSCACIVSLKSTTFSVGTSPLTATQQLFHSLSTIQRQIQTHTHRHMHT